MLSRVGTANNRRVAAGGTGHLEVVSAARTRPYEGTGRGGLSHDEGVEVEAGKRALHLLGVRMNRGRSGQIQRLGDKAIGWNFGQVSTQIFQQGARKQIYSSLGIRHCENQTIILLFSADSLSFC